MAVHRHKSIRRRIKYKLLLNLVMGAIQLANLLPRNLWLMVCAGIGRCVPFLAPKIGKEIATHLAYAYGSEKTDTEITSLSRRVLPMLARNAGLVIRNFSSSPGTFYADCVTHGAEHADVAFRRGGGVIFLTAHLGPFECVGHDLSLRGYHPLIIGTPLKDESLNALLTSNRTKFGAVAIERGKETFRIIKSIKHGGTVAILIDQDTRVKSVFVDFFGKPCSTPAGAAVFAMRTGAAIIPVFAHLNVDGIQQIDYYPEVEIKRTGDEEADIIRNTQTLTTIIENQIRKFPEQWIWMHKRWKTIKPVCVS